ncbi:hypothetical protein [Pseudoclavibacter sp. JSM 162008]|uniref:hypothetical protein n=1 Tax=Pseudoclavibacter sp. JSM 162008 TaxID=3229855 RepID=UPI0035267D69
MKLLIQDLDVTVINAATGEVLRELTIDLGKDYRATGNPRDRPEKRNSSNLHCRFELFLRLATSHGRADRI